MHLVLTGAALMVTASVFPKQLVPRERPKNSDRKYVDRKIVGAARF
jgi:hypothetical protein